MGLLFVVLLPVSARSFDHLLTAMLTAGPPHPRAASLSVVWYTLPLATGATMCVSRKRDCAGCRTINSHAPLLP